MVHEAHFIGLAALDRESGTEGLDLHAKLFEGLLDGGVDGGRGGGEERIAV